MVGVMAGEKVVLKAESKVVLKAVMTVESKVG